MQKTTKKLMVAAAAIALVAATVSAAPKKKLSKAEKDEQKNLEKQFKNYKIQKDAKGKTWDFGGMKIILGDFWSSNKGSMSAKAVLPAEEDKQKFTKYIDNVYNVDIDRYGVAGWDQFPQFVANFCVTGGDENYMFEIDSRSLVSGIRNNLFWDLSEFSDVINWNDSKWAKSTFELSSGKGKSFYACRAMPPEPRQGLYFNKQVLRDAGINPDSIYDMQKNGTWNWENFEKVLSATTRDIDNDGVVDIYGFAGAADMAYLAAQANGTNFIEKDKNGKYVSHIGDDSVMEAMTWLQGIYQKYQKPRNADAAWDWYSAAFKNSEVAFICHALYYSKEISSTNLDYGFVAFPYGPRSDKVVKTLYNDNIFVLPKVYNKERATKILKAFDLWSDTVPGYKWDDEFTTNYYPMYRDSRAVDETIKHMLTHGDANLVNVIPGINQLGDYIWNVPDGYMTPQEAYETTKNPYKALLDEANR